MADDLTRQHSSPGLRPGASILVVGLGRFGSALAQELEALGYAVLGIDRAEATVARHRDDLTQAVEADAADPEVLDQLQVAQYDAAVVAIGDDVEASILATAGLSDSGVPWMMAKAANAHHARILHRVGADEIVSPEHDMGRRAAHLIGGSVIDWFQVDEEFAMVETEVPSDLVGRTLADAALRVEHGVTVVAVKSRGGSFTYATAETRLAEGDVVVVAGPGDAAERFARRS